MKASICIASYNHATLLQRTLASIAQQHPPFSWEVIVVDDGSPDDTHQVCLECGIPVRYERIDRPLCYRNPSVARNIAYKMARGEVIIAQSDDVIHAGNETIERLVKALAPGTFVIATVQNVDQFMQPVSEPYFEITGPTRQEPYFFLGSLYRSDLYAIGGNDEDFTTPGFDDDWFADCLISGRNLRPVFSENIVGYHQHHKRPSQLGMIYEPSRQLYMDKYNAAMSGKQAWIAAGGAWSFNDDEC